MIAPAAGALLAGAAYGRGALGGSEAPMPVPPVTFEYFGPSQLGIVAGTVILGLGRARWYIRRPAPLVLAIAVLLWA
jgi:hypothetical protein